MSMDIFLECGYGFKAEMSGFILWNVDCCEQLSSSIDHDMIV
jgi:hypothetical protein